ncbi:MAG TPA: PHB depolymerase family esterase [Polyangiaceae bacterium]|nr:PHB depolymerase family esterase [Polyangiaceae bacterium]
MTALRRVVQFALTTAAVAFAIYQWQLRPPSGTVARTFAHGGRERRYLVHPGPGEAKAGLLLVLHGSGGRGRLVERRTGFDDRAERAGIVTAYPDGIDAVWNDGWRPDSTVDDVGFLSALASALAAEFHIDPAHVYATGFSNGAGMAHRLACESGVFSAIAPVGGYPPSHILERCNNSQPVSVLDVHGTADPVVPYEPLARVLQRWASHDACTEPTESVALPDTDPDDGTRVRRDEYRGCRGARLVLYSIEGGGHTWPGEEPDFWRRSGHVSRDIDASALILDFVLAAPAPAAAH